MKKVLLFLIFCFVAKVDYAQRDSSKLSPAGAIQYRRPGLFRAGKFTVDGRQISLKEVNTRLMNYQPSVTEYEEYRKNNNLANYSAGTGLAFLAASLISTGNSSTFKNTSSKVFFGLGVAFIIPEAIFVGKRNRHFSRAVQLYNQQFQ